MYWQRPQGPQEARRGLLEQVQYDTVYAFAYSPRPGTRALDLSDEIPTTIKMERLRRLLDEQKVRQEKRYRAWIGREVEVLVDGPSKRFPGRWTGRTRENRIVHFEGQTAPGRLEQLRVVAATPFSLRGVPVAA